MMPEREQRKTPRTLVVSSSLALLAAAVTLTVTGCKKSGPAVVPPPIVQVLQVTTSDAARSTEFVGKLDSPQTVEVRARVEAFVDQVLFKEGTEVKLGDPLFVLDRKPFEEKLAAANGVLAETRAALNKSQKDVARLTPLAEKKAIPQQDLDNAIASVAVAEANVLSAEAQVKSAEIDLGYCAVHAPVSGLIGARNVSVGSLVGKGEPTLLATISELDPIWYYTAISEVDFLHAQRTAMEAGRQIGELPVSLILADGSEYPHGGKWVFVDRAVDVTTGTIRARAEFPNPQKILRPGMFARIRISLRDDKGIILVPERALSELQGKSFVWVVGAENKASQRPVRVAPVRIGGNVVVLEGLKAGEHIIVEGVHKVREGLTVQPVSGHPVPVAGPAASHEKKD
jgi:membrane fusion protein (multidrug efflux system)